MYRQNHAVGVRQHIIVPEADDAESLLLRPPCASLVGFNLSRMLAAIDFDDQPSLETQKVDDIGSKRDLVAKTRPIDLLASQSRP